MTIRELMKLVERKASTSALPRDRELRDWPIYVETQRGQPVMLLEKHDVSYGFVGGRSAIVLMVAR